MTHIQCVVSIIAKIKRTLESFLDVKVDGGPVLCGMWSGNLCCVGCGWGTGAVQDVVGEPGGFPQASRTAQVQNFQKISPYSSGRHFSKSREPRKMRQNGTKHSGAQHTKPLLFHVKDL